jgi:hypothetical protein
MHQFNAIVMFDSGLGARRQRPATRRAGQRPSRPPGLLRRILRSARPSEGAGAQCAAGARSAGTA